MADDVEDLVGGGFTSSDDDDNDNDNAPVRVDSDEKKPDASNSPSSKSNARVNGGGSSGGVIQRTPRRPSKTQSLSSISKLTRFYGTASPSDAAHRSRENTPSMSQDEMQHDFKSKHFSAEKFVEKKVSDLTVNELITCSNTLNQNVKALDSEMQMMVYDNYNKFIHATDTIRNMKDQVENMETEMNKLIANMENIATHCGGVEGKFSKNRCQIDKLVSVRGLFKKLEFLFELPRRLRKNIELGAYDRAVTYFKMATSILASYKHEKSFNRISIESQEIINDLQQKLKRQMVQKDISATQQLETAKLLLSLNQQPELLWYDIFKTRKDALMATIIRLKESPQIVSYYEAQKTPTAAAATSTATLAAVDDDDDQAQAEERKQDTNPFASDMNDKPNEHNPFSSNDSTATVTAAGADADESAVHEAETTETKTQAQTTKTSSKRFFSVVEHFRVGFLTLFVDFVEQYNAVFIAPFQEPKTRGDKKAQQQQQPQQQWPYEKSVAALTSFTRDIFFEFFNVIKACLQKEENVDKLTEELQSFYDALYGASKLVPNARLHDKGTEIIESCIRAAMEREFGGTRKQQLWYLVHYLANNYDITRVDVHSTAWNTRNNEYHIKQCVLFVRNTGVECLNHLVPLTTNQSQLINVLDLSFDDQLWSYTTGLFRMYRELIPIEWRTADRDSDSGSAQHCISSSSSGESATERQFLDEIYAQISEQLLPIKLVILAKIVSGIGQHVIEEIIKHFKKNFLYDREQPHKSHSHGGIYKQELLLFQRFCQQCSNGLRLLFAQRIAAQIIVHVDALESRAVCSDATPRQQCMAQIQHAIENTIEDISRIYATAGDARDCHLVQQKINAHDLSGGLAAHDAKGGDLREYDKLFNDPHLIYDKVSDDANALLFTVYKIVFKHWSEILRLKMIRSAQFTLIQKNINAFRQSIPKVITKHDFSKLQTLLDEVQQSAKERCIVIGKPQAQADTVDID